jgi:hypothetical protein
MAYLKYITEAEFMKILQSVLKLLRKEERHDHKKSVSPHGTAIFLKHIIFATLNSVCPVTTRIKCCLQYTAVLNRARYISSTSHVTQVKIIHKDAYITEDLGICC